MKKRDQLENEIQRQIMAAIGSEPDLLLLRNQNGRAQYTDESTGRTYFVPYGLGEGTSDLVALLRRKFNVRPVWEGPLRGTTEVVVVATWFCLEVKVPGEEPDPHQMKSHRLWRSFGAFVAVAHSPDEAIAALERARRGEDA